MLKPRDKLARLMRAAELLPKHAPQALDDTLDHAEYLARLVSPDQSNPVESQENPTAQDSPQKKTAKSAV